MYPSVSTREAAAVAAETQTAYLEMFGEGDRLFVSRAFGWAVECFSGKYADFQAIDARYHDLEHTLQGTLCLSRLLRGRHRAGAKPNMSQRMFELTLLGILFHDSGYLKKRDDTRGTGAKYTLTHVQRSAAFAAEFLGKKGFGANEIKSVQNMICCTGITPPLTAIPFQNEEEKIGGFALATADILGQMAAEDYVNKLPLLYSEFAEAAAFTPKGNDLIKGFSSAADLINKTPAFWDSSVKPKLESEFEGAFRFLNDPYPSGRNDYMDRIEANVEKIRRPKVESCKQVEVRVGRSVA
jgi:hypothetical protein